MPSGLPARCRVPHRPARAPPCSPASWHAAVPTRRGAAWAAAATAAAPRRGGPFRCGAEAGAAEPAWQQHQRGAPQQGAPHPRLQAGKGGPPAPRCVLAAWHPCWHEAGGLPACLPASKPQAVPPRPTCALRCAHAGGLPRKHTGQWVPAWKGWWYPEWPGRWGRASGPRSTQTPLSSPTCPATRCSFWSMLLPSLPRHFCPRAAPARLAAASLVLMPGACVRRRRCHWSRRPLPQLFSLPDWLVAFLQHRPGWSPRPGARLAEQQRQQKGTGPGFPNSFIYLLNSRVQQK